MGFPLAYLPTMILTSDPNADLGPKKTKGLVVSLFALKNPTPRCNCFDPAEDTPAVSTKSIAQDAPMFNETLNISATISSGLQASYFAAYFICPLTISGLVVRKYGFRVTFMTGETDGASCGMSPLLAEWCEEIFGSICGSMFVSRPRAKVDLLEHSITDCPFTSSELDCPLWKPLRIPSDLQIPLHLRSPKYSEIRLNLGQAVQGVGAFVAPFLASRVFFANTVDTAAGLKNITDADQEALESQINDQHDNVGPFKKQYNLFLGVWSQFCYVGAQVAIAADLLEVAQGLYTFMRFVASCLMIMKAFKPRYMLTVYLGLCFVFSVAAMTTTGSTSVAMIILVLSFESLWCPKLPKYSHA
ncbi:hypothetical protein N7449_008811 [Penicillium cf. viridicatum]|uniref:Uncharacterized protein n=1 Tax=Penicillium cf. viridicatum TaxID=2972119 RepID=A0A9W9M8H3_9EURO|nr:hypothetical protein N7449_008811 [Penicillium cf. viridicatum]